MSMTENAAKKICFTCKVEKELSEFTSDKQKKDGLTPYCKSCRVALSRRDYEKNKEKINSRSKERYKRIGHTQVYKDRDRASHLKRTYNITVFKYNDMFIEQGGCCAICGTHQSKLNRRLVVDHCHETDVVRGLLCRKCNAGLGHFNDSLGILKNVMKYLELGGAS